MRVLDAEFTQGFIRMANDGWEQGWHERNGGNLSYRMKPEEVDMVKGKAEIYQYSYGNFNLPTKSVADFVNS